MRPEQVDIIAETFREVVGKQAFMLAELAEKPLPLVAGEEFRRARVELSGDVRGTISLVVPREMCREIAANMLGVVTTEHLAICRAEDAFLELANVFSGHLRSALAGKGAQVRATVPELSSLGLEDWENAMKNPDSLGFLVDDTPVLVEVSTEGVTS